MNQGNFSAEDQQMSIDVVSRILRQTFSVLFSRLAELERLEQTQAVKDQIVITKVRLDVLGRIEVELLTKVREMHSGSMSAQELMETERRILESFTACILEGIK